MHVPDRYRETDPDAIRAFVDAHPFATLVTAPGGEPRATHLPLLLEWSEGGPGMEGARIEGTRVEGSRLEGSRIIGHVARANPQWRDFDGQLSALAIFDWGPHAYVSPRWYGEGQYVPTWNYVSVQMRGVPVIIDDAAEHRAALRLLTERFEPTEGYSMDALPEDYLQAMVSATVAFRIPVDHVDAAFKLNQNRNAEARRGVVDALAASEDSQARAIADLMRDRLD